MMVPVVQVLFLGAFFMHLRINVIVWFSGFNGVGIYVC